MIEIVSLLSSTTSIVADFLRAYRESGARERAQRMHLTVGGMQITLEPDEVTPELIASLEKSLKSSEDAASAGLPQPRRTIEAREMNAESPEQAQIGAVALAIDPDGTFENAKRQSNQVFKMYRAITIALAAIFVGSLLGALVSGFFLARPVLAIVFAGATVADLATALVFRPLSTMKDALLSVQRLDLIHRRLQDQLKECGQYEVLASRIRCQNRVWDKAMKELKDLHGVPAS